MLSGHVAQPPMAPGTPRAREEGNSSSLVGKVPTRGLVESIGQVQVHLLPRAPGSSYF